MGRLFKWLIPLALITFGLLWPLVFRGGAEATDVADPVVFSNYKADFVVGRDGQLDAVETITAEFPGGRHGIFRWWDIANQNNERLRQRPEVTSILLDGEPVSYQMLWEGGERFRVAKIGDPDEYLAPGTHVFEIRYSIAGVLDPGTTGADKTFAAATGEPSTSPSVFFWNVITGSNSRIERADISITLPGDVGRVQCSVGYGVGRECRDVTVSGNKVDLWALNLQPQTPVTVRAGVDVPTPPQVSLPWPYTWDRILGQSVTGVAGIAGLTALFGLGAFLWYRTTVEPSPGFPLQYAPPPGLGPVQAEYIRTESVPKNGLTATLFYLAERGLIDLRQVSDKQWNIRGKAEPGAWADVDPVSVAVGSALKVRKPGTEFQAKHTVKSGQKLNNAKTDLAVAVSKWAYDNGLMVKRKKELWVRTANAISFILMFFGIFRWGFPVTMCALPFAAFFLFSAGSWADGVGSRRTPAGRELWSRVGGFHRMLATDSAETRFDFSARKDLYTAYVPFAVAAGVAALWAKKYETAMGSPAPQPDWYNSSSATGWGFAGGSGGPSFDSFDSALSSSIGAYTASQSSSSSGGGGGGGGWVQRRRRRRRRWRRKWLMVRFLLIVVLVLAVLVLIVFVMGYNKIRSADVRVAEALSGIDVELTRRASLIPSLVHTVQTFATHEKGILDHVTDARAALTSATAGKSVAQRSAAEKELDTALAPLLALGQSYPQLNSSNNFLNLQDNLADTENKLAFARQYYNDSVATLNRLISTIPWMFVAPLAGVDEREYYQTPR